MNKPQNAFAVGDRLPELVAGPVDRATLALFAGASGDHNPIHIDIDFARRAGMPDVFAHGMLVMAWLGRLLTNWMPQAKLTQFDVRFQGITQVGHLIHCNGEIVELLEIGGVRHAKVRVGAANQYQETKAVGEALIALD